MASKPNWKPWQTNPFLIGTLLAVLIAIVGVLEYLAQRSTPTVSSSVLRNIWLDWFIANVPAAESLRSRDFDFGKDTGCLQGFIDVEDVSGAVRFAWIYLPSILAILLAIVWGAVDAEVKRVEPYYQMSKPEGATASSSIFAEYISLPSFLSPFQAIRWKQWVVLVSTSAYVLLSVVTPVLQSQLFQLQVQVLTVGYYADGEYNALTAVGTSDWNYYEQYEANTRLDGRCWIVGDNWDNDKTTYIGEIFDGNPNDAESQFNYGALRAVVVLNPAVARAQEAVLLLVVILGALLIWKCTSRKSGMTTSYASLATLVSIGHVYPDFLQNLSGIMDLDNGMSKAWRKFLSNQIVHLGHRPSDVTAKPSLEHENDVPDDPEYAAMLNIGAQEQMEMEMEHLGAESSQSLSQNRKSPGPYGLYFEPFSDPGPSSGVPIRNRQFQYFFRVRWAMLLSAVGLFFCFILALVSGGTTSKAYAPDASFTQSSQAQTLPIVVLVVTAIVKSIWKMVESNVVEMTIFRFRAPSANEGRLRPHPVFAREYVRLPPIWITIAAFRDKQIMLGFVTFASLCLEVAFLLLAIVASMAEGQGFNATVAPQIGWAAAAFIGYVGFFAFCLRFRLSLGYPNLLCKQGSIASLLGEVALSHGLLSDLQHPGELRTEKERVEYLRQMQTLYCVGKVRAPNLTHGVTYMLERREACLPEVATDNPLMIGVRNGA